MLAVTYSGRLLGISLFAFSQNFLQIPDTSENLAKHTGNSATELGLLLKLLKTEALKVHLLDKV